jgi:hypothetical protein
MCAIHQAVLDITKSGQEPQFVIRLASIGGKTATKRGRASPIQQTGCIAYLRPRALTLSTSYFSPEIYGKGSEPGRFAEIAQSRQSSLGDPGDDSS